MTEPQSISHGVKHASFNLLIYAGICVIAVVAYMAYATDGFTKPMPWFRLGVEQTSTVIKTY